jgi:hypothetical protein
LSILSNQIVPEWRDIVSISYRLHAKEGKTPSMCVVYNTLSGPYREWICYEHSGMARERAHKWHDYRCVEDAPKTVAEALKLRFREPKRIQTRQAGKYHEICGYDFA